MNIVWILYFANLVSNLHLFFALTFVIVFIGGGIASLVAHSDNMDEKHTVTKWWATLSLISVVGTIALPNDKTLYMMVGAHLGQIVMQDPEAMEIKDKVMKIVNKKMDELLEDKPSR